MTDWGAHHFDIAQWGLGMDESGPIEIIPPQDDKDLKAGRGLKYRYANGVEVIHGGPSGITFVSEKGEIFVNRGQLTSKPGTIVKEPIDNSEIHLYQAAVRAGTRAIGRTGSIASAAAKHPTVPRHRRPHRGGVPLGQHRLPAR